MNGVKLRIALIETLMSGTSGLPDVPLIETGALQFRKILELIAFGSLVANEKIYASTHKGFATEWNAKKLLKKLEQLKPHFYPAPVKQVPANMPGVLLRHEKVTQGYLTRNDFVDAYQYSSELIHTTNPYSTKTQGDLKTHSKKF